MENQSFDWGAFILGVISIIVALIAFANPIYSVVSLVIVVGIAAIIKGVFELFVRPKSARGQSTNRWVFIIIGIIDLIIGFILLFNIGAGVIALPLVFSIWFIIDSIGILFSAASLRNRSNPGFWISIVLGIIGIVLGVMMLFNPVTAMFTVAFLVGIYFLLAGISGIVSAF